MNSIHTSPFACRAAVGTIFTPPLSFVRETARAAGAKCKTQYFMSYNEIITANIYSTKKAGTITDGTNHPPLRPFLTAV